MSNTKIEWATKVWNPVTGCTKVSEGCRNCYAEINARRFWGDRRFHDVKCHPDRLDQPLHWRKPQRVFVNSMGDLFHKDVPDEFIDAVFAAMAIADRHQFVVLTKRPGKMAVWATAHNDRSRTRACRIGEAACDKFGLTEDNPGDLDDWPTWPLPNVILGVSVEDQKTADLRIPPLLLTPAAGRVVSVEPMLGPVDFRLVPGFNMSGQAGADLLKNLWVICGGESGPWARPMHPAWAGSLRDQCVAADVPFFFKQWGEWIEAPPPGVVREGFPSFDTAKGQSGRPPAFFVHRDGTVHCFTDAERDERGHPAVMVRIGKKAAGNLLDGQAWEQYPKTGGK